MRRVAAILSVIVLVRCGVVLPAFGSEHRGARPPCTVTGTNAGETLHGTSGSDVICAGAGDDDVFAGPGDDVIFGGPGQDDILGGGGSDKVFGGRDRDELSGGAGRDRLYGEAGRDVLTGDGGADVFRGGRANDNCLDARDRNAHDRVFGGPGLDGWAADPGDSVQGVERPGGCPTETPPPRR